MAGGTATGGATTGGTATGGATAGGIATGGVANGGATGAGKGAVAVDVDGIVDEKGPSAPEGATYGLATDP